MTGTPQLPPSEDPAPVGPGSTWVLPPESEREALADLLSGDVLGDRYELIEEIGRGGMGTVYRARQVNMNRSVALKVLNPAIATDESARERFRREMHVAAALVHPNTVSVYDFGTDGGQIYLAMEFLEGQTLLEILTESGGLDVRRCVRILKQVLAALQAIHERGIVHRDIKPENIMVLEGAGAKDWVKVLDFGIARIIGNEGHVSRLTCAAGPIGSPNCMAPEQISGDEVDARADLYAVGALMMELATGRPVFEARNPVSLLSKHLQEVPASLNAERSCVPDWYDDLAQRLLAKNPNDRPDSAGEVLAELESGTTWETNRQPFVDVNRRSKRVSRRTVLLSLLLLLLALGVTGWKLSDPPSAQRAAALAPKGEPIRVGILHSETGTMAASERPVIEATLFAIEQLNARGGVLGRPVEAIVADGRSNDEVFAREAARLAYDSRVPVIFGCWTSASRKQLIPAIAESETFLFYPVQYEGLEDSPDVFYLGMAPNQQILPGLKWCYGFNRARRFFLVGSDYVFPHAANEIMKDEIAQLGAEIVGEVYVPLGGTDMNDVIDAIRTAKPDTILSTINGDSNIAFFRSLRAAGIDAADIPVVSFSLPENELRSFAPEVVVNHYAVWSYFQSIDTSRNRKFVASFVERFDRECIITDPMAMAYSAVMIWAESVERAKTLDREAVRTALGETIYEGPAGKISIDSATQHGSHIARVGRVTTEGQFEVVWSSGLSIPPRPFPESRSRAQWEEFLVDLYAAWGNSWSRPSK